MGFDEKKIKRDERGRFSNLQDLTDKVNQASAKLHSINPKTHRSAFIAQHKVFQQEFRSLQKAKVAIAKGLPKGRQNKSYKK